MEDWTTTASSVFGANVVVEVVETVGVVVVVDVTTATTAGFDTTATTVTGMSGKVSLRPSAKLVPNAVDNALESVLNASPKTVAAITVAELLFIPVKLTKPCWSESLFAKWIS